MDVYVYHKTVTRVLSNTTLVPFYNFGKEFSNRSSHLGKCHHQFWYWMVLFRQSSLNLSEAFNSEFKIGLKGTLMQIWKCLCSYKNNTLKILHSQSQKFSSYLFLESAKCLFTKMQKQLNTLKSRPVLWVNNSKNP